MSDVENPPAFPVVPPLDEVGSSPSGYPYPDAGMTLRDYFAAQALAGMASAMAEAPPDETIAEIAYRLAAQHVIAERVRKVEAELAKSQTDKAALESIIEKLERQLDGPNGYRNRATSAEAELAERVRK